MTGRRLKAPSSSPRKSAPSAATSIIARWLKDLEIQA